MRLVRSAHEQLVIEEHDHSVLTLSFPIQLVYAIKAKNTAAWSDQSRLVS